ncbi:hypothetical protein BDV30DRAFT_207520 [Aspergillus minisclerotigenes]|uniref:Uncharacterized protein n=1 Tax=Aspergillus minisclerotigenes TaxID=656917 RepID=A0A5N6JCG8_9EURO|nr:hypothetical protein BDV30DRAFT_207520 [Aspergillus minisclerotigenes]
MWLKQQCIHSPVGTHNMVRSVSEHESRLSCKWTNLLYNACLYTVLPPQIPSNVLFHSREATVRFG